MYTQPVAGLVEAIEAGRAGDDRTREVIRRSLRPLLEKGIDTLVLGCTHYPLVHGAIAGECGPGVAVIDTGEPVARQLQRRLKAAGLLRPGQRRGRLDCFTSGPLRDVAPVVRAILADPDLPVARARV